MDVSEPVPHSCKFCQEIKIDGTPGTSGWIEQSFTWPLPKVQTFAEECALFKWSLQPTVRTLKATDRLALYVSTDHEDLEAFEVEWKDANGKSVPFIASEQLSLHIFAEKSMFP
jgi:hypothetical protein